MADSFRSERILARTVTDADSPEVAGVYAGNRELLVLLDRESDPDVLARRFVQQLNVPPKVHPSSLHNLVLLDAPTGLALGILSLCTGYPSERIAYIGELFLHPEYQGAGRGREICLKLESMLRQSPMQSVRVGVGLKNWNALRFWIRLGYTHITGMSGDRNFAPEAHAFLELQKNL